MAKEKKKQIRPSGEGRITIYINPLIRRVTITCIAIEIFLFIIDALVNHGTPHPERSLSIIFDMSIEDGLAGWLSGIQILFAALTLWLIYFQVRMEQPGWKNTGGWFILAIFFTYMAVDDGVEFHEQCANFLGRFSLPVNSPWFKYLHTIKCFPTYYWQMLFGPFFAIMGIFMLYFLWKKLEGTNLRKYLIAGLLCYIVATGMDFYEGLYNSYLPIQKVLPLSKATIIHFLRTIEEFLELFGTTLLWVLFLKYFAKISEGTKITLRENQD